MNLINKINELNSIADSIHEATRKLNIRASGLNGVAAKVPADAPAPGSYFKGVKVILHNVSYDIDKGCICSAIMLPHTEGAYSHFSGTIHRFKITENWFK